MCVPKDFRQFFKGYYFWIEYYLNWFCMSCIPSTYFVIGRIFYCSPRIAGQNRFDSSDSTENCLTTPETSTCECCNLVVLAIVAHVSFLITPFPLEWNEWTVSWHTPWCFYLLDVLQEIHAPNVPRNLHPLFLSLVHQDQVPASMHWETSIKTWSSTTWVKLIFRPKERSIAFPTDICTLFKKIVILASERCFSCFMNDYTFLFWSKVIVAYCQLITDGLGLLSSRP